MMNIEVTTMIGCRNNCTFCPQSTIISQYKKHGGTPLLPMDFLLFKTCIDKLPEGSQVLFSGMCEAFLNPRCAEMVTYTSKKGLQVSVYTTLMGMSLKDVEILKKIPFNHDQFSFVIHLPSKENIEHIDLSASYMEVLEAIYESTIPAVYHYHGDSMESQLEEFFKDKIATIEHFPHHSRAGNLKTNKLKRRVGKIGCLKVKLYGSYGHVLLPDGTVVLCCQDYAMKHVLGNLRKQSFEEIIHSEEMIKVEEGLGNASKDILCRNCEFSYDISLKAKISNQKIRLPDHHE